MSAEDKIKLLENYISEHKKMTDSMIEILAQENTQIKQQLKDCKEFATTYERELLAIIKCKGIEITKLQQQLKDKDEKISKAIEYCNKNTIFFTTFLNSKELIKKCNVDGLDILDILESNKED